MNPTSTLTLIAQSAIMRELLAHVETAALSDSSLLLVGETGVGKELFAEYIHKKSPRENFPFVKVGLASLPAELLESEHVLVVPGSGFNITRTNHLRLTFLPPEDTMSEVFVRMERALARMAESP